MKRTLVEFACLGLLLMGTAGIVMSLFVKAHAQQLEIVSSFAVVILAACIAKSFLPAAQENSGG
jgi:hypothetical protein